MAIEKIWIFRKRCLIYARVSTKQQTTENQLPPLRKFAKDRGWKVVQELVDHGYSGTTDKRPQLIEVKLRPHKGGGISGLGRRFRPIPRYAEERAAPPHPQGVRHPPEEWEVMNLARRREFDILLVYALDRSGRSVRRLVNALDEFRSLGIDFCVFNQNIDTTTRAGKLFFTMIAGFAEFEAAIIKERGHAGLARARAEGKKLGPPFRLKLDLDRIHALRRQKHSIRGIAEALGVNRNAVYQALQ